MVFSLTANVAPYLFEMEGKNFRVLDFFLRERMSSPYELELSLASEDGVDFDDAVGKEAIFTIKGKEADRHVHGVVHRLEQTGVAETATGIRFHIYNAVVGPSLWLLSLERDCRIFQEKSVPDIVKAILEEGGVSPDRISFRLQGAYDPRIYCVQYRETDLDFISRLLEEEGIFYYFEHDTDSHVMVFGDSVVNYQPVAGNPVVDFNPGDGLAADKEFIDRFTLSRGIRPARATLRDFNFEKPSLDLTCDDRTQCSFNKEIYDYPGEYTETAAGKRLAKVRLQEAVLNKDTARGHCYCPRFVPGFTFSLKRHELDHFNQEYLLVEVCQSGAQPQALEELSFAGEGTRYENHFSAVAAEVVYRPERATPRPVVEGVQSAIVVGPKGEEIYTDEYGRVKVQFHWDREGKRDEKSSCWIRVGQIWAGAGWGGMFIPRIGQEVIVDFLEGDPDKPIVTGRVYHATNTTPYPLPADKTKSTIKSDSSPGGGGSNELRFEDAKGDEEVYLHAQKDWSIAVENDKNQAVGHDESLYVSNNRTKTVGADETITVDKNRTITVANGDDGLTVAKGHRTVKVDLGNHELTVGTGSKTDVIQGPYEITVNSGYFKVTCGASQLVLYHNGNIEISGNVVAVSGAQSVDISGNSITSEAAMDHNTRGSIVISDGSVSNTVQGAVVMLNP